MHIDIIGAGIGGLTASIALSKKGISSQIFEQAPFVKPVGAGIILANNAMQVYEMLGLKDKIREAGNPISRINITDKSLKSISTTDLGYFEKKYDVQNIAIHRGALQEILTHQIPPESISLNHQLRSIQKPDKSYEVEFSNGTRKQMKVLIGADGIHSKVRDQLFFNSVIRQTNQVCWRGVLNFSLPKSYQHELNEAWGKGDRFGFVQISEQQVYWYALKTFEYGPEEFKVENLSDYFGSFDPLILEIIKNTHINSIYTSTISDLTPRKNWSYAGVCLIGDAAHATTPNMGQGACQAIEDAYCLAECLAKYPHEKAFSVFETLRIKKAHQVVKTSWMLGKMAHWRNPLAINARNLLMKLTPKALNRMQSKKIFELAEV